MMGNSPLTGRTVPSRLTSPITTTSFRQSGGIAPAALSTLAAIARSCEEPRLGMEAGERFTVTRVCGQRRPQAWQADLTRSRASDSEASGRPMMLKYGRPGEMKACTWMMKALMPINPMDNAPPMAIRTPPVCGAAAVGRRAR